MTKTETEQTVEVTEQLAASIAKISDGMDKLLNAKKGIMEKTIIILLQDETKLPRRDIKEVLRALPRLKELYCKPVKK